MRSEHPFCLDCGVPNDRAYAYCSECNAKRRKARKQKDPERFRKRREQKMYYKYGITVRQYEEMLEKQNHVCAICGNSETRISNQTSNIQRLSVDHCHTTGKVRGLLCNRCNTAIGRFEDNEGFLENAINYLNSNKGELHD